MGAWHGIDMAWGWWVIGPLMMVLFWGAIIWLIAALVRGNAQRDASHRGSPTEIARRRYASGEIDEREYEKLIGHLHAPNPQHGAGGGAG